MILVALDFETYLITDTDKTPKPVCLASYTTTKGANLWVGDGMYNVMRTALIHADLIIGHNIAYDMNVAFEHYPDLREFILGRYNAGCIVDTMINEQLRDMRVASTSNKKSLATLAEAYLGMTLDKDAWRLSYADLDGVPLDLWPEGAREYPKRDAEVTYRIFQKQGQEADLAAQTRAAFWLEHSAARGLLVDPAEVDQYEKELKSSAWKLIAKLQEKNFVKGGGNRNVKVVQAYIKEHYPESKTTPTGKPSTSESDLRVYGDPHLTAYSEYSSVVKALANDVPLLRKSSVHTHYGMAVTGRTTSSGPNIQNLPKDSPVRKCLIPRPGYVFAQADYETLEMRTLAQNCLWLTGKSKLAEVLNANIDPHKVTAANILNKSWEHIDWTTPDAKHARSVAKGPNFGLPGLMGARGLAWYMLKTAGIEVADDQALAYMEAYFRSYPEVLKYFDKCLGSNLYASFVRGVKILDRSIREIKKNKGRYEDTLPVSGRKRLCFWPSDACNLRFQGCASDLVKHAGWLVTRGCYDKSSPLYGSRIVAMVHDEFILEVPEATAAKAAAELGRLMISSGELYTPDVPLKTEPVLMHRWDKSAIPIYHDGKLIPWIKPENPPCPINPETRKAA